MEVKAIITGASGMVGKGVLLECLENPNVKEVLVINRSSINIQHPKLKELLTKDFYNLTDIEGDIKGYNACFFCLGTSSVGKSEEDYGRITHDLTLSFAEKVLKHNEGMTFCYVSGTGTDSTEQGNVMWARVKGRTENVLLNLPFKGAYMFRPGYIQPLKGTKTKVRAFHILYTVLRPFYPIFKYFPKTFTDTVKIGKAMINTVVKGYDKEHLEILDINRLSE